MVHFPPWLSCPAAFPLSLFSCALVIAPTGTLDQMSSLYIARNVMVLGSSRLNTQHSTFEMTKNLCERGGQERFGIHREATESCDIVYEMDEINGDFCKIDVLIVIGGNDIVNRCFPRAGSRCVISVSQKAKK